MEEPIILNQEDVPVTKPAKIRREAILNDIFPFVLLIVGTCITSFWYLREVGWWGNFSNTFDSTGIYHWVYQMDPYLGYHGIFFLIAPFLFIIGAIILYMHHRESRWNKVPLVVALSLFILWSTVYYAATSEYVY